jgi:hypothetical protein
MAFIPARPEDAKPAPPREPKPGEVTYTPPHPRATYQGEEGERAVHTTG